MKMKVLFMLVILGAASAAKFPNTWKACKAGQNQEECLRQSIQGAVPDLVKGLPKLGVLPIDPLKFKRIAIDQRGRPVGVNVIFTDMEIEGLKNVKIDSIKNDWKTMVIRASAPVMKGKSKYTADGKILVLPIQGDGDCTLQLDDFTARVEIKFEEVRNNGKTYYKVKRVTFDFDTKKLSLNLKNLFNGNKQLGDQMNLFISENWEEILKELKPAIISAFEQACTGMASTFFNRVPKNEITPS